MPFVVSLCSLGLYCFVMCVVFVMFVVFVLFVFVVFVFDMRCSLFVVCCLPFVVAGCCGLLLLCPCLFAAFAVFVCLVGGWYALCVACCVLFAD